MRTTIRLFQSMAPGTYGSFRPRMDERGHRTSIAVFGRTTWLMSSSLSRRLGWMTAFRKPMNNFSYLQAWQSSDHGFQVFFTRYGYPAKRTVCFMRSAGMASPGANGSASRRSKKATTRFRVSAGRRSEHFSTTTPRVKGSTGAPICTTWNQPTVELRGNG